MKPILKKSKGKNLRRIQAYVDPGAEATFISEHVYRKLS